MAQLTASGVTLPVGAPAAAQALMVTALGNSNVSSSEGQPTLPLFAAASHSNAGGGGGPSVTYSEDVPSATGGSIGDLTQATSGYFPEGEGCGNTAPCVTFENSCPASNGLTEVFLDHYDPSPSGSDRTKTF